MSPRDLCTLLALAAIWGSSFLLIRLGVAELPALAVVELRLLLGALGAGVIALALGVDGIGRALRRPLVAATCLCAAGIPFALYAIGETRVSSGVAGISNATTPLVAAAIAQAVPPRLGGERLTPRRLVGLTLGFAGVIALAADGLSGNLDAVGLGCCLLAPVFYAVGGVLARHAYRDINPIVPAVAGNLLAALLLLPLAVPFGIPSRAPSVGAVLAVVVLGVVGTGIAFVLFYRLLASLGSAAFTVTYLMPVVAVVEGAVFLGEQVRPLAGAALVAILAGVAVSNGLVPRRRSAAPAASRPCITPPAACAAGGAD